MRSAPPHRIARMGRQMTRTFGSAIEQRQPGFVPGPPAARVRYRSNYQTPGFSAAERFAAGKRRLSGASRTW